MTLLQAVTDHGTGALAKALNHPLGGKTGTTSDYTDAWFMGFSPSVTCGVWVGYDSRQSLGEKETGAKAALPIWMTFMKQAIAGKDSEQFMSDSPDKLLLKAGTEAGKPAVLPAKRAGTQTAEVHPPLLIPAKAKPEGLTRTTVPMAFVGPLARPSGRPAGTSATTRRPASTLAPVKTLVKPAIGPQIAPVADRQVAKIKPALSGQ